MKLFFQILIPLVIVAACILIGGAIFRMFQEEERPAPPQTIKLVHTQTVHPTDNAYPIEAFGKLVSASPVDLISEVEGSLQAGDIRFIPGQSFRKNDVLLRIDSRQAQLNLNSTKSDYLNALATVLPEIKIDFPNEFPVWERYFNACNFESELAELPPASNQKIKLFLSRFDVYKLYFSIKRLEIDLEKHTIRAPFNGSIVSTDLRVGSTVRAGTRLGRIISLDQLEVEVSVPAENVAAIDRDASVMLSSSEIEGQWQGRILRVGDVIDDRTQSVPVYLSISSMDRNKLYDGVFLQASFGGKAIPASVMVPRKAVYENRYVYVVDNGTLLTREVQIGRSLNDKLIVRGGLQDGDTVVTDVLQGAYDGMPVRSTATTAAAANGAAAATETAEQPETEAEVRE